MFMKPGAAYLICPRLTRVIPLSCYLPSEIFFYFTGGRPPPSADRTTVGFVVVVLLGGSPPPSAKATEANDMSNSVTARIRFITILLIVGNTPETV